MIIKSFRLFESKSENNFPDLEEIKSYLYDFTDETSSFIDDYEFGYIIFDDRLRVFDVLNNELRPHQLEYYSDLISLNVNKSEHPFYKNRINSIESGKIPGYEYIYIQFNNNLFDVDKLEVLLECLETIYSHTGFRPVSSLWSEDYVSDISGEVETKYGFQGTFVRVSDQEYDKLCRIFKRGEMTPTITKLFKDTRYNN